MAELKETHVVTSSSGPNKATPWLAFLVGALLIAVGAAFVMNTHARISGPAGTVDLNVKPPAVTAPVNPAPAR